LAIHASQCASAGAGYSGTGGAWMRVPAESTLAS
jgi:hypothetical protein